MEHPHKLRK